MYGINTSTSVDTLYPPQSAVIVVQLDLAAAFITPVITPAYEVAEELSDTGRGQGGFGSTGRA